MNGFTNYDRYDGLGLAALIAKGAVSADEVLEAAIARIEARNPALNAVIHRMYDEARRAIAAGLPEGPFHGVPFLLKDLYTFAKGAPCGNGSRLFADFVAEFDDEMVTRHRRAGLVIVGKTNTSELGISVTTEPAAYGATRNPWNPAHVAGGSSGGAGTAVAAGMVPLAHASDGGGSIRCPASACGLFGLKPSRARNPDGEGWAGLAVQHAITRSVRDSAALLDATHGPLHGAAYWAPPPERPFLDEVGVDPGRLRIAYSLALPSGYEPHETGRAAVEDAAALAADLGHTIEPADPPINRDALLTAMITILESHIADTLAAPLGPGSPPATAQDVERATWLIGRRGTKRSAVDYVRAGWIIRDVQRKLADFFDTYDILLTPTVDHPSPLLGAIDSQSDDLEAFYKATVGFIPYTQMFNMSGQPAASIPLYWDQAGLPIGVQIAARLGGEATLFRLASQFEQARPWFDRRPPD